MLSAIQAGEYPENMPLPAERSLCETYHVSRTTIRQALLMLKNADIIYSIPGHGTYVKPQVFTQPLTRFYSFTDTLKSSNILIKNDIIICELVYADRSLAKNTGFAEGSPFHKLIRLRSAREYPLMLETTFLPKSRFIRLDVEALSHGSLYEFLQTNYNFRVDKAHETIRPVMPTPEENTLLQLSMNTPCILLERFSYEEGLLAEYTKSIVRGDKYIFHVDFTLPAP